MVYQNLNKTEKYHPTTTKRKKLSPADRDSMCESRGGSGGPDPPGKSQVIWVSIGYKQLDPPGKCWTPSGTLKNDSFVEINHLTSVK